MTLETKPTVSEKEIFFASEYIQSLARRGVVCKVLHQDITLDTDPETNDVGIAVRKSRGGSIATLRVSAISSLNPVITIKRLHADSNLKLFGVDLPKAHLEVEIKDHMAQLFLVNLQHVLTAEDAIFQPLNP